MSSRRIIKHEQALRDLERRSEYIRLHNPRAALRFLDEAEATIRLLASRPGLGVRYDPEHPILAEVRFFPISRFKNDLIFYQPLADGVQVLRVLHGAQDIHGILAEDFGIDEGVGDNEADGD
jgi:toxin ParE1/3/4